MVRPSTNVYSKTLLVDTATKATEGGDIDCISRRKEEFSDIVKATMAHEEGPIRLCLWCERHFLNKH